LNPLGRFLRTSTPRIWSTLEYPECLPTRLNPLAERSCFSQVWYPLEFDEESGDILPMRPRKSFTLDLP
jgi:hypothetical protein